MQEDRFQTEAGRHQAGNHPVEEVAVEDQVQAEARRRQVNNHPVEDQQMEAVLKGQMKVAVQKARLAVVHNMMLNPLRMYAPKSE